jgi:hypothetical protein
MAVEQEMSSCSNPKAPNKHSLQEISSRAALQDLVSTSEDLGGCDL